MIRYLTAALILASSSAVAQTRAELEATQGLVYAAFSQIYCGIRVPDVLIMELSEIADKNGLNRREYADAIVNSAADAGMYMTSSQRANICATTLRAYRNLGVQR